MLSGGGYVVTGASRGIGLATAQAIANAGGTVFGACRSSDGTLKTVITGLPRQFGEVHGYASCDVTDASSINDMVNEAAALFEAHNVTLAGVVNAAGTLGTSQLLPKLDPETIHRTLAVNLVGPLLVSKSVCRHLLRHRVTDSNSNNRPCPGASIVNVGSVVGRDGNIGQCVYSASKSGLIGMTKSLSKELASRRIRVNLVEPGFISTSMTRNSDGTILPNLASVVDRTPLRRIGNVDEVANVIVFLLSDKSSFVTGQIWAVDGGLHI